MIKIIAIGKNHEPWVREGVERYSRRLSGAWKCEWILLPHSARSGFEARQDESGRVLSAIKPHEYVILLDERGEVLDSPALSRKLDEMFTSSRSPVFVIGGAYGINQELISRADLVWSLSLLVFPHQLVRLILAEQLYRAQAIATGHPYHHE